jgi:hypothetical protein
MDDKVRYFVGPGQDVLNKTQVRSSGVIEVSFSNSLVYVTMSQLQLRPYAQARDTETKRERFNSLNPHVPFSPNVPHHPLTLVHPTTGRPFRIAANDTKAYGKWYRSLSHEERMSVIAQQRKKWFEGMVQKPGGRGQLAESVTEPEATTA